MVLSWRAYCVAACILAQKPVLMLSGQTLPLSPSSNSREKSRYVFDIRLDQAYFPPQSPGDVTSRLFFLAALGLCCSTWASPVRGVQMLKHVGSGVAA